MHYKKCEYCKKDFYAARHNTKYCGPACMKAAQKERDKERYEAQRKELERPSLAEVNRMAREAGMSYGKFVAMQYAKEREIKR